MALQASVRGSSVKLRNPFGAFALSIITFGIYYFVWYYKTNRELRDFGAAFAAGETNPLEVDPTWASIAIGPGGVLIVPPFVSEWRYYRRIARAQRLAGMDHSISHVTGFLLWIVAFVLLPFEVIYAQHHLNRLWRHELAESEKAAAGMRG